MCATVLRRPLLRWSCYLILVFFKKDSFMFQMPKMVTNILKYAIFQSSITRKCIDHTQDKHTFERVKQIIANIICIRPNLTIKTIHYPTPTASHSSPSYSSSILLLLHTPPSSSILLILLPTPPSYSSSILFLLYPTHSCSYSILHLIHPPSYCSFPFQNAMQKSSCLWLRTVHLIYQINKTTKIN